MGWEQDERQFYQECLPSPPGGWIRLNLVDVVGKKKLFSVVIGKRNMSKDWVGAKIGSLEFHSR